MEIFLIIFLVTITAINVQIYKLFMHRYFYVLRQLCQWKAYLRKWIREELQRCRQQQG